MTEAEDEAIATTWLINQATGARLSSGTVLHLQTPDPEGYPLPHPDLLRLNAAISRVVRCAGASGEKQGDDYCGEEDEDEEIALSITSEGEEEGDSQLPLAAEENLGWVLKRGPKMPFALKRFMQDSSSDIEEQANITRRTLPRPTPVRARTTPYIHPKLETIQGHMSKRMPSERL